MQINIKIFVIIIAYAIQFIGSGFYCQSWGETTYKYYNHIPTYDYTNSKDLSYLKKTTFFNKTGYITHPLNIVNHPKKILVKQQLHKKNEYSKALITNNPKIHIQNDSINISHVFYDFQNRYKKMLPFFQIGLQNVLSNKIFSIGGGNRYIYNDFCAIGYNTFYHFPISNNIDNIKQPGIINISGQYWYNNILFMLNSLHTMNNFIYENKHKKYNTQYPIHGYQIYIHTQFPTNLLSVFTGKMILEHYFYNNKINKKLISNDNLNKNYYLTVGIDYYPISILGFNINKTITREKFNNGITYKILINYKFNTPLVQQINYTKNIQHPLIFDYINHVIPPFIPTIRSNITSTVQHDSNNDNNDEDHCNNTTNSLFKSYYKEITGYPGEIKQITIENDEDDKNSESTVQWDIQSIKILQSYGGNIYPIQKKNTYIIYMPYKLVTKEDTLVLTYNTKNDSIHNPNVHVTKQILLLVNNYKKYKTSLLSQNSNKNIIHYNNAHEITSNNDCFQTNVNPSSSIQKKSCLLKSSFVNQTKNNKKLSKNISLPTILDPTIYKQSSIDKNNKKLRKKYYSSYTLFHDSDGNDDENNFLFTTASSINNLISSQKDISYSENHNTTVIHVNNEKTPLFTKISDNNSNFPSSSSSFLCTQKKPPTPPPMPMLSPLLKNTTFLFNDTKQEVYPFNTVKCNATTYINIQNNDDKKNCELIVNNKDVQKYPQLDESINNDDCQQKKIAVFPPSTSVTNQDLLHLLSAHKQKNFGKIGTYEHINKLENTTTQKKYYSSEMEKIFAKLQISRSDSSIDELYDTEYDTSNSSNGNDDHYNLNSSYPYKN